jgi:ribosomal protein S18 acetylase RimI-like enzyme
MAGIRQEGPNPSARPARACRRLRDVTPMAQTSTRLARLDDIPVLAVFEREIARLAFPEDPIEDLEYHTGRLQRAMAREPEGMVVLVEPSSGERVAWLWLVTRTTLATGERYGVLRSLYVRPWARRAGLGTMLAGYAQRHFAERGIKRVVVTLHAGNLAGVRALTRAGFESIHVTLEWRDDGSDTSSG